MRCLSRYEDECERISLAKGSNHSYIIWCKPATWCSQVAYYLDAGFCVKNSHLIEELISESNDENKAQIIRQMLIQTDVDDVADDELPRDLRGFAAGREIEYEREIKGIRTSRIMNQEGKLLHHYHLGTEWKQEKGIAFLFAIWWPANQEAKACPLTNHFSLTHESPVSCRNMGKGKWERDGRLFHAMTHVMRTETERENTWVHIQGIKYQLHSEWCSLILTLNGEESIQYFSLVTVQCDFAAVCAHRNHAYVP